MTAHDTFPSLRAQFWLAKRIGRPDLFAGATDEATRRERLRAAILDADLAGHYCGMCLHRRETFGDTFARFYGQPLSHKGPQNTTSD